MPPKVPAGAAAAAAAEDESSSSSEDEKGEAGTQSKQSKLERKSRKAVAKLGLKPITGVTRVTLRRQKSYQVRLRTFFLLTVIEKLNLSAVHHHCPRRL
jgi:hypothetical protein